MYQEERALFFIIFVDTLGKSRRYGVLKSVSLYSNLFGVYNYSIAEGTDGCEEKYDG